MSIKFNEGSSCPNSFTTQECEGKLIKVSDSTLGCNECGQVQRVTSKPTTSLSIKYRVKCNHCGEWKHMNKYRRIDLISKFGDEETLRAQYKCRNCERRQ